MRSTARAKQQSRSRTRSSSKRSSGCTRKSAAQKAARREAQRSGAAAPAQRNQRELERLEREKQQRAEQQRQLSACSASCRRRPSSCGRSCRPRRPRRCAAAQQMRPDGERDQEAGRTSQRAQMQIAEIKEVLRRAGQSRAARRRRRRATARTATARARRARRRARTGKGQGEHAARVRRARRRQRPDTILSAATAGENGHAAALADADARPAAKAGPAAARATTCRATATASATSTTPTSRATPRELTAHATTRASKARKARASRAARPSSARPTRASPPRLQARLRRLHRRRRGSDVEGEGAARLPLLRQALLPAHQAARIRRMLRRDHVGRGGGRVWRNRVHRAPHVHGAGAAQGVVCRRRARSREADGAVGSLAAAQPEVLVAALDDARRSRRPSRAGASCWPAPGRSTAWARRCARRRWRPRAPLPRHHRRGRLHARDGGARRRGARARRGAGERGRLRRRAHRRGGGAGGGGGGRQARASAHRHPVRRARHAGHDALGARERATRAGSPISPGNIGRRRWRPIAGRPRSPDPLGVASCVSIPWGDLATAPRSTGARPCARTWRSRRRWRRHADLGLATKALAWGPAKRLAEHLVSSLPEGPTDAERARAKSRHPGRGQTAGRRRRARGSPPATATTSRRRRRSSARCARGRRVCIARARSRPRRRSAPARCSTRSPSTASATASTESSPVAGDGEVAWSASWTTTRRTGNRRGAAPGTGSPTPCRPAHRRCSPSESGRPRAHATAARRRARQRQRPHQVLPLRPRMAQRIGERRRRRHRERARRVAAEEREVRLRPSRASGLSPACT